MPLTKVQKEAKHLNKPFEITSVCRLDLERRYGAKGVLKITDCEMREIASKLADDYCEQLFLGSLDIIAEHVLGGRLPSKEDY